MNGPGTSYIVAKTGKVLAKSGGVPPPAEDQEDMEDELDAKWAEYLTKLPPGADTKAARKTWLEVQ